MMGAGAIFAVIFEFDAINLSRRTVVPQFIQKATHRHGSGKHAGRPKRGGRFCCCTG